MQMQTQSSQKQNARRKCAFKCACMTSMRVMDMLRIEWRQHHIHRSHFGSRYKLGCCGHAGLFFVLTTFWLIMVLLHFDKLCARTSRYVRTSGAHRELPLRVPPLLLAWLPGRGRRQPFCAVPGAFAQPCHFQNAETRQNELKSAMFILFFLYCDSRLYHRLKFRFNLSEVAQFYEFSRVVCVFRTHDARNTRVT